MAETIKAHLKTPVLTFQLEGQDQFALFKAVAETMEVFGEPCCGYCESNYRYVVRVVGDNEFPELHCNNPDCRAKLAFGQMKKEKGRMFPIRKLTKDGVPNRKNGKFDNVHRGWTKAFANMDVDGVEEED